MARDENVLQTIKDEILEKGINKPSTEVAFLSGVIRGAGELTLSFKGYGITIKNDNKKLIEFCLQIINNKYSIELCIEKSDKDIGMKELIFYRINVPPPYGTKLVKECGIIENEYDFTKGIPQKLVEKNCDKKAYMKGVFLSCGLLYFPDNNISPDNNRRKNYHLEFCLNSEYVLNDFILLINDICGFDNGIIRIRKNKSSIYIKSAQKISDCLAAMGANKGVMILQEIMATRAMRNYLNRGNNFILANIDKSITASNKQLETFDKIEKYVGLEKIEPRLLEVIKIRREFPDKSLEELAKLLNPPTTKSGINHRMRKLNEIAENLKEAYNAKRKNHR